MKVRPSGWSYGERDYAEAERSDAPTRETEVSGSNPAEAACVGEKRKAPEPGANADESAKRRTPILGIEGGRKKSLKDIYEEDPRSSSQPEKDEEAAAGDGETAAVEPADDDGLGGDSPGGDSPGGDSPGGDSPGDETDDETEWRSASIVGFNAQTGDHQMLYSDGTREWLPLILHETKPASD